MCGKRKCTIIDKTETYHGRQFARNSLEVYKNNFESHVLRLAILLQPSLLTVHMFIVDVNYSQLVNCPVIFHDTF